jgi:ribosome-associated toxin RatA of RatAB toxin-antitoxin module
VNQPAIETGDYTDARIAPHLIPFPTAAQSGETHPPAHRKGPTMRIHFNETRPANASAATLFEVITDYPAYSQFNSAVTNVRLVRKDDVGAEFVADRTTKIGKNVHAYDRYERHRDMIVERTYEGTPTARSTWTIHPVDADHCTLTIDAVQDMSTLPGLIMKPLLRHMFYKINFTPFIGEAERRARQTPVR